MFASDINFTYLSLNGPIRNVKSNQKRSMIRSFVVILLLWTYILRTYGHIYVHDTVEVDCTHTHRCIASPASPAADWPCCALAQVSPPQSVESTHSWNMLELECFLLKLTFFTFLASVCQAHPWRKTVLGHQSTVGLLDNRLSGTNGHFAHTVVKYWDKMISPAWTEEF